MNEALESETLSVVWSESSGLAISISPLRGNGWADLTENMSASVTGRSFWPASLMLN
jgi:sulfur transfer protein SufE